MTRQIPFQIDRPIYAKVDGLRLAGREYSRGDHIPWKEKSMDQNRIMRLFNQKLVYHNDQMDVEKFIGDGLDACDKDELQVIVDNINAKVKKNVPGSVEYSKKKCRKAGTKDRQMGLIRSWRRNYGHLEY